METAGLVLAAGAGRRYGMPKAVIPYGGRLLVQRAADTLRDAGVRRRLVVLGAQADRVRDAAPDLPETVLNPEWATGMGSSLRAGLRALAGTETGTGIGAGIDAGVGARVGAVVVLLVDMPGVTAEAVRRVARHAATDALAMGGYDGRRGHPVLLGRDHWAGVIEAATGDRGARDYLRAHAERVRVVPVGDVADDTDLDVPVPGG